MTDQLKAKPSSVIGDVRHLATALYQDRVEILIERGRNSVEGVEGAFYDEKIYQHPRQWAEIGGITNQRAAAILKDFLDEFNAVIVERDRLKATLRQIAETAIKVGDV